MLYQMSHLGHLVDLEDRRRTPFQKVNRLTFSTLPWTYFKTVRPYDVRRRVLKDPSRRVLGPVFSGPPSFR